MANSAAVKRTEAVVVPGDEDLIARVAAGDQRAFAGLTERYDGLLFSIAYRMRFDKAEAEDIVQETLLRLWKHAGSWDPARGASVKTWLCRMATNLCIDRRRRQRYDSDADLPDIADPQRSAQARLEQDDAARIVGAAVQDLPARQRTALVLFHYEEMSMAEIAAIMNISQKSVESLLGRARQALRAQLRTYKGVI